MPPADGEPPAVAAPSPQAASNPPATTTSATAINLPINARLSLGSNQIHGRNYPIRCPFA
jgi:hypothetical protein